MLSTVLDQVTRQSKVHIQFKTQILCAINSLVKSLDIYLLAYTNLKLTQCFPKLSRLGQYCFIPREHGL